MNDQTNDSGYANFIKAQSVIESIRPLFNEDMKDFYPIIFKLCTNLMTEEDIQMTVKFLSKLYQNGYLKSVEDHRKVLEQQGLTNKITF